MSLLSTIVFLSFSGNIIVDVKNFGAKGDGITDDAIAINSAAATLHDGDTLSMGENKTYRIGSKISITVGCTTTGKNVTIVPTDSLMRTGTGCMSIGKGLSSTVISGLKAVKGSTTITLPVGIVIKQGDLVQFLGKDTLYDLRPGLEKFSYLKGQYAIVVGVGSNNAISVSSPFFDNFNINKIAAFKSCDQTKITGINFDLSKQPSTQNPFLALSVRGTNVVVENCNFTGNEFAFFALQIDGENATVKKCIIKDFFNSQGYSGGRLGYGIAASCNNIRIMNNTISNCKHAITSAARSFVVRNIHITGNTIYEDSLKHVSRIGSINPLTDYAGTIDVHAGVSDSVVINNNTIYAQGRALFIRNGRALITGNSIFQSGNPTGLIGLEERPLESLVFDNNTVRLYGPSSYILGIYQSLSTNLYYMKNVKITRNMVYNGNIFLNTNCKFDINGLRIVNNSISNGKIYTLSGTGNFSNIEVGVN